MTTRYPWKQFGTGFRYSVSRRPNSVRDTDTSAWSCACLECLEERRRFLALSRLVARGAR